MELLQYVTDQEKEIRRFQDLDHVLGIGVTVIKELVQGDHHLQDIVAAEMIVIEKIAILHEDDTLGHHHILVTGKVAVAGIMKVDHDHVHQCHLEEGIMVIGRILLPANV